MGATWGHKEINNSKTDQQVKGWVRHLDAHALAIDLHLGVDGGQIRLVALVPDPGPVEFALESVLVWDIHQEVVPAGGQGVDSSGQWQWKRMLIGEG